MITRGAGNAGTGFRVVIVDQDAGDRSHLARCVEAVDGLFVAAQHRDLATAEKAMRREHPDLLLLESTPDRSALDLLRELPSGSRPKVVLFGHDREHAADALDLGALDFVVKPASEARVRQGLHRGLEALERLVRLESDDGAPHPKPAPSDRPLRRILIQKSGRKAFFVPAESVRRLEAEQNYVRVYYDGGSDLVRTSLNDMEHRLDPAVFRRVHRAHIVNLDEVEQIAPRSPSDYEVTLRDGTVLPVGRAYRNEVLSDG